jgi:hypothetical protein
VQVAAAADALSTPTRAVASTAATRARLNASRRDPDLLMSNPPCGADHMTRTSRLRDG